MKKFLLIFFVLSLPLVALAEDSKEDTLRIALQRSREATIRCEDNLADIWSQANTINKELREVKQNFDKMKQDYDNIKKQLEAQANAPQKGKEQEGNK